MRDLGVSRKPAVEESERETERSSAETDQHIRQIERTNKEEENITAICYLAATGSNNHDGNQFKTYGKKKTNSR